MTTDDKPDQQRRLLLITTTAIGAVGLGLTAVPFVRSMLPSARAQALGSPVEINFAGLEEGQMLTVSWRSKPVWVLKRSKETLKRLTETSDLLVDPESLVESQQPAYAQNINRSVRPDLLVVVGVCTHLGCIPGTRFAVGATSGLGESWPGGYFCACHGSKFDLAGRVFKNVPAPTNLVIPPYRFLGKTSVLVGEHPKTA
ncbi:MAG: ubiquinol-cytochrome c reductase iron-sulfur subunit [Acidiferrobacterales bacterium]